MREIEINLPGIEDTESSIARIDAAVESCGLIITTKGTLKTYPGCVHWHIKNGRQKGTLEITLWPARRRAWFKIQAGRRANWIDEVLPSLKKHLKE